MSITNERLLCVSTEIWRIFNPKIKILFSPKRNKRLYKVKILNIDTNKMLFENSFSLWTIPLVILLAAFGVLMYHGLFKGIKMQRGVLHKSTIIYIHYQGIYNNIGSTFQKISEDTKDIFTNSPCIGIYFDYPAKVKD